MDLQNQTSIEAFSDFIRHLHNQTMTKITDQIKSIATNSLQKSLLEILNLLINQSLQNRQQIKSFQYFQSQQFVISSSVRKIGEITKILSLIFSFEEYKQGLLARFETTSFYQSQQFKEMPQLLRMFLYGIFPTLNVHKDNIPLYMPNYQYLESYRQSMIGNPNWDVSRHNLSLLYQKNCKELNMEIEQKWFLLLTGNKKILDIYRQNSLQCIWSFGYYFYLTQTLCPYRTMIFAQKSEKMTINQALNLIEDKLKLQNDKQIYFLLLLIMDYLKDEDATEFLVRGAKQFFKDFDQKFDQLERNQQNKDKLKVYGLINALLCQLVQNMLRSENINLLQYNQQQQLFQIFVETQQKCLRLVRSAIPNYDFYLRIAYSSHTKDKNLAEQNKKKIMCILKSQIQQSPNPIPFPVCDFGKQICEEISQFYLEKYPEKILEIAQFLSKDILIWKILNYSKLNEKQHWLQIKEILEKNETIFVVCISEIIKITEEDLHQFKQLWTQYHSIFQIEDQMSKASICTMRIDRLLNRRVNPQFANRIYLPLNKSENMVRITDYMIEDFENIFVSESEQKRTQILNLYLSFLESSYFKSKILSLFTGQEITQFWKKWSIVYFADEDFVASLINPNDCCEQIQQKQSPPKNIIKQKKIISNYIQIAE